MQLLAAMPVKCYLISFPSSCNIAACIKQEEICTEQWMKICSNESVGVSLHGRFVQAQVYAKLHPSQQHIAFVARSYQHSQVCTLTATLCMISGSVVDTPANACRGAAGLDGSCARSCREAAGAVAHGGGARHSGAGGSG